MGKPQTAQHKLAKYIGGLNRENGVRTIDCLIKPEGILVLPLPWNANELFNELLVTAEGRFGLRSRALRIDVRPRNHRTPETVPDGPSGCVVHYFQEAEKDYQQLRFQLAHEAIHALSGALVRDARKLEEGLAVWFSLSAMNRQYRKRAEGGDGVSPLFLDALQLFEQLKPTDSKISKFRLKCPDLDQASPELVAESFSIEISLASRLCQRVPTEIHLR
jgi:hypothetical protein